MILMITPGVLVFANDIQDDSIVSEIDDSLYTDIVETTDDMSISEENESEHESNLDESTIADNIISYFESFMLLIGLVWRSFRRVTIEKVKDYEMILNSLII